MYEELSVFRTEKPQPKTPGDKTTKKNQAIVTKLILIINNWSFVRDNKANKRKIRCSAQDVVIGFKLASSAFRTSASDGSRNEGYDFDKNGLVLPYPAFISLMRNSAFTDAYVDKIRQHYQEDTGHTPLGDQKQTARVREASNKTIRKLYAEEYPELADDAAFNDDNETSNKRHRRTSSNAEDDSDSGSSDDNEGSEISEAEATNGATVNIVATGKRVAPPSVAVDPKKRRSHRK